MSRQRSPFVSARNRGAAAVVSVMFFAVACSGGDASDAAAVGNSAPAEASAVPTTPPVSEATDSATLAEPAAEQPVDTPSTEPATPDPEPAAAPAVEAIRVALPVVDVVNLANGETTGLNDLTQPGATLLWFWAPH